MRSRFLFAAALALGAACASLGTACGGGRTELAVIPPDAGSDAPPPVLDASPPPIETSNKVDLLLVIDNSPNTENFQALFAATAPYLLRRFAQPACVNGLGNVVATTASPTDPCPDGQREFQPVTDLHVGVVTSSLGGAGADTCSPASVYWNATQNDAAHLVTRGPMPGSTVPTYQSEGFLAWDPGQTLDPPGESDINALAQNVADLGVGAGDQGCGFEATLESMYRFLVDPDPYQTITVEGTQATLTGTDTVLLQQRSDFLRPDSALMVVIITDEDDCSVQAGGEYYLVLQGLAPGNPNALYHLPPPRSACATNPDDPCCASCGETTPAGCSTDPACSAPALSDAQDPINLRCFDQKRRFGIDFLYPVQRYVDGLTNPTVVARDGSTQPNPLYTGNRSPKLVMVTGILGVPWQDIASTPTVLASGYQPGSQVDWSLLLGDPTSGTPPTDPLMVKSIAPRTGANPPTGAPLEPPDAGLLANPINGHERDIPQSDDLQYACVYARPTPIPCNAGACNCLPPDIDTNPACQAPDGTYSSTETYARALPSTRPLQVLQALGDRASVASICAQVTTGADDPTYAYKPAADAILRALRPRLP
jgi:hypothetical protein